MSKIGRNPILIPENVQVAHEDGVIKVKGPLGELSLRIDGTIKMSISGDKSKIIVERKDDAIHSRSMHGLTRTLIANMVIGTTQGFSKSLKVIGTGYRAKVENSNLVLSVGFSHPVEVKAESGIKFEVKGNNIITISGSDKQLVGQYSAQIRKIRPPDPYKGKGIRYTDEIVRKKAGKAAKTGPA